MVSPALYPPLTLEMSLIKPMALPSMTKAIALRDPDAPGEGKANLRIARDVFIVPPFSSRAEVE